MSGLERRTAIFKTLSPGDAQGFPGIIPQLPVATGATNLTTVQNRAVFIRFVPEEDMLVTKMSFHVSTLDAADPAVDIGVYDTVGQFNKIVSSGSTTGVATSTGIKTLSMVTPAYIAAGSVYYAAVVTNSVGIAIIQARSANAAINLTLFGASAPNLMAGIKAASGPPLPANLGGVIATGNNNEIPLIAIRTD